ncbi:hypothetical protein BCR33DRAFT_306768 [Rhizoclosmatium globosum]|uniref:Uncharacterized protein n=1 Tax=Rhizoclosmatium globosum TaxID=329046 RepID=A0A1Y2C7H5_9FUNG|nr:hypothetical protein BCR33DRAFT_306768 [Rhizoclosmatium globosum]|eukprot:ORY42265.1 hypothetical protein BCR33DRAFT_306768 [Rhizoclosmatium globosum]
MAPTKTRRRQLRRRQTLTAPGLACLAIGERQRNGRGERCVRVERVRRQWRKRGGRLLSGASALWRCTTSQVLTATHSFPS